MCDAIRFLDCYVPYYTRTSEIHDPLKNIAMVLEQVAYPDKQFVEGLFQVTNITANGVKVTNLENLGGQNYTVDLRPNAINMTHLGMILNGTLSRPKKGTWEISDLKEVFPGEAVDYLLD